MIASYDLICAACGKPFQHRRRFRSRRKADEYRDGWLKMITFCPDCYRAQLRQKLKTR